jgi:hypothetical protein
VGEQRLELRAEQESPVREERVVKRLDAEPIAREEQRRSIAVIEGEREHSA